MSKNYFLYLVPCLFILVAGFSFVKISNAHSSPSPNPNIIVHDNHHISINFDSRISCNFRIAMLIPYSFFEDQHDLFKDQHDFFDDQRPKKIPVDIDVRLYQDKNMIKSLHLDKLTIQGLSAKDKIVSYGFFASALNNRLSLKRGHYTIELLIHHLPSESLSQMTWSIYSGSPSILGCFSFF